MPRRKGGKAKGGASKPKRPSKSDASVKKWNTADDIPMDEVDQFHNSRDKILLDGDGDEYMDGEDDEEVFALKGVQGSDSEDEEDEGGYYDDDDQDMEEIPEEAPKSKKGKKKGAAEDSSDEEKELEEEEEESWGRGKAAYYNSNADELESDDEEGHELEEQEARRLQAKAREHYTDEDFGLDDIIEIQKDDFDMLDEPEPTPVALPTEPQDIVRHLEKTNPEALALARDWEDTAEQLVSTQQRIAEIEATNPDAMSLGMLHLHYQTLLSYTTVLAFYIHLRASTKYAQNPTLLQSHPIMKRLLSLKQALITMEDLDFAPISDDEGEDGEFSDDVDSTSAKWDKLLGMDVDGEEDEGDANGDTLWDAIRKQGLEDDELADLIRDAEADNSDEDEHPPKSSSKKAKKEKKSKEPPKKKRKVDAATKPVFDLQEPEFVSTSTKSSKHKVDDDTYGESEYLHNSDAADKAARKKSLQFHTSKIESASARRQNARSQAIGGDDDIPYRERAKEKQMRMDREAKKRLAEQGGADLDDEEPALPSGKRKLDDDESGSEGGDSPDEYYELVKKKSKEKKEKKKAEHDAAREAVKIVENDEAEGPRSLTRAILKNKGLTPHRSKAVRNPRVKKRQKFEQAKKKLSSQKAIYKGGVSESGGRYDGERSGISKVIKSVRLG